MRIKILLADDHKIVRDGLRAMIAGHPDMEVVAEAENGRTAVRLVKQLSPDVVIMDISMPDLNGIEATRHIIADAPRVKIIALSMHSDGHYVKELFKAGASGYLLKECAFEELANAIHTVAADQIYLSPRITHVVINDYLNKVPMAKNLRLFGLDRTRAGSAAAPGRRKNHQGNRLYPGPEHKNRRSSPAEDHGEIQPAQRRGADQVRHPRRPHLARSPWTSINRRRRSIWWPDDEQLCTVIREFL